MNLPELRTTGNTELDEARKRAAKARAELPAKMKLAAELREKTVNGEITVDEALRLL